MLSNTRMLSTLLRSDSAVQELKAAEELDSVFQQDVAVVFKHSTTCPVSWMAHHQVTDFQSSRPEVPVYLLSVKKHREVSNELARRTGVTHQSPQVLIFRRGSLLGSASHGEVTSGLLERLTRTSAA